MTSRDNIALSRLRILEDGPWWVAADPGEPALTPPYPLEDALFASSNRIDLAELEVRPSLSGVPGLSEALSFFPGRGVNAELRDIRAALDHSLDYIQLLELAVATGYLPLEAVWTDARRRLSRALWSQTARDYVQRQGWIGIRFLASRVEINLGLSPVAAPTTLPFGAIRFAAMLSELRLWHIDGPLDPWLDLLDEFSDSTDDKHEVASALDSSSTLTRPLATIIAGADLFVERLGNLLEIFPERERPIYAVYFGYWLGRFFGCDIVDGQVWASRNTPDWPALLVASDLFPPRRCAEIAEQVQVMRAVWQTYVAALEDVHMTRETRSSRQPTIRSPRRARRRAVEPQDLPAEPAAEPAEEDAAEPGASEIEEDGAVRRGWWTRSFGA